MKVFKNMLKILILVLIIVIFKESNVYAESDYTLEQSVAYAMSLLDDNMTEHEKAFILAQYCQEGNVYNMVGDHQSASGVLVAHEAVCAGYARAFELLCNTAGLQCTSISSPAADHSLNLCYLDGEWTYVDVTRGVIHGGYAPACFSGTVFSNKEGITKIHSNFFEDFSYTNNMINEDYIPEGVDRKSEFNFSFNCSRVYYDENYKYYSMKDLNSTISYIYKENRTTAEKTKLGQNFAYSNYSSGIVKDENSIYYIGTDAKTIYSINLDGENKTTEYTYTGTDKVISQIFVQDGYIYYQLSDADAVYPKNPEWIKWEKMVTAAEYGSYTLNNSSQKYILNYIKTSKGIVIASCEGIDGNEPSGTIYIPDTINNLPVIGIEKRVFFKLELEGELTLPENLEYIGSYAFSGTNISKINFNEKIKTIGNAAFNDCTNLTGTLELPDSIVLLQSSCFRGCYYEKIKLPNNIKFIPYGAFSWNRKLDGIIVIPEGVISVGNYAFGYTIVDAAILPSTLENLGKVAFNDDFSDNDFTDLVIKSEKMKSFYNSEDYTIYLIKGTETSDYADTNGISYTDLNSVSPTIELLETNINLNVTTTDKQLSYTITPKFFEAYYDATWSSSNEKVVTVDENGLLTPVSIGSAEIYLTMGDKSEKCIVNVSNVIPEGYNVQLNYTMYQLNSLNESITLKDEYLLASQITWTSNNEKVATVDENGKVTPKNGGFVKIKASTDEYGSKECWIYVCVLVELPDGGKTYPGDLDRSGNINGNDITIIYDWYKRNLSEAEKLVADIDGNGVVDGNDAVLVGDIYKYGIFKPGNEYVPITSVSLNKLLVTLDKSETVTLIATITPSETTNSKKITWVSDNSNIATVDQNGVVTAIAGGTTTIKAITENNISEMCVVTVNGPGIDITGITLSDTNISLKKGETKTITATVSPSTTTLSKTVTWTSSDTSIATVNPYGKITAISSGTVTITATTANGIAETCTVKVIKPIEIITNDTGTWIVQDGEITNTYTGLYTDVDGTTYYFKNSKLQTDYTDIIPINNVWTIFINGKTDYSYTGIGTNKYGTWYVKNGTVLFDYKGYYTDNNKDTYYFNYSKLQTDYTDIIPINNVWTIFIKGKTDYSYTGIATNKYGTWYVKNGTVLFDYTGYYTDSNKDTYYFNCSKLQTGYTQVDYVYDTWRMVIKGKVDYDYTGIGKNKFGTWYVENGKVTFKVNKVVYVDGIWRMAIGNKIDYNYTGIGKNQYGTWYVEKGKVTFKYTGTYTDSKGITYKIVNSKVVG